jgi:phage protein D
MADQPPIASQVILKLAGQEVQDPAASMVTAVTVDQHAHLPGMFTLRFQDPGMELLDKGPFDLTKEVEVLAEKADGQVCSLIKGEITALEPQFREGMISELVVRGYDKSHRLFRETRSEAYINAKDSDIAKKVADRARLGADIEQTRTVYDHVYQHNQTDLEFLMQRAWRIGFECYVADGKLVFRKPRTSATGVTLAWGGDLLSFNPRMTLAEQVDEVVVKGWDAENQKAITGSASQGQLYPKVGESKKGAAWAGQFSKGKRVFVDQPVLNQAEANLLAAARLDEISGAFLVAEGTAFRRPDIQAGKVIKIEALGERFSGEYLVTGATHLFTPEGLRTEFNVRGTRTGLLSETLAHPEPVERWPGVVVAVVTNTNDPKKWGRVKVKYPWLADDQESDWIRVLGIGAGPKAGLCILPEVNDEVLVAFVHGSFNQPVILGGLWSAKNELPDETAAASGNEKPLVRAWRSRTGHRIVIYDNSEKKMEIVTQDGRSVTLTDKDRKITLKTKGVEITLEDNKLTINADGDVNIKAGMNLKLEAGANLDVKAGTQANIKGATVNIN